MKRSLTVLFIIALSVSCAVVEPPSGGPEDMTPATVESISPSPDSAGVSRQTSVEVAFSEKIDSESFRKKIRFFPPVEFEEIKVDDNVLKIRFVEALPETTICLVIKKGYRDLHGVESDRSRIFYFSTSDSLPRGKISGSILFKGKTEPGGTAVMVSDEHDTARTYFEKEELRIAVCDDSGNFAFRYLPTDSSGYRVWGYIDKDKNGEFSRGQEFSLLHPDTIFLTAESPSSEGLIINVIDPNEPGEVGGVVINGTDLKQPVTISLTNILEEKRGYFARADSTGGYQIRGVIPGDYILSAFIDVKRDSVAGYYPDPADSTQARMEPAAVYPDTVKVSPAQKKKLESIKLFEK